MAFAWTTCPFTFPRKQRPIRGEAYLGPKVSALCEVMFLRRRLVAIWLGRPLAAPCAKSPPAVLGAYRSQEQPPRKWAVGHVDERLSHERVVASAPLSHVVSCDFSRLTSQSRHPSWWPFWNVFPAFFCNRRVTSADP